MRRAFAGLVLALAACRAAPSSADGGGGPALAIEFAGAETFPRRELDAAIEFDFANLARRSSPKSAVDDAAYSLVEFYRARGFPDCRVEYEVLELSPSRLHARLTIEQGPRTLLEHVEFAGNEELEREQLLAVAGLDRRAPYFVEGELDAAADALASHYSSQGFTDVRVAPPEITLDERHEQARVTFRIQEGVRQRLASAPRIEGGLAAIDAEVDTRDLLGKPLSPRLALDVRGRIEEAYQRRGHPDVEVEAQARPSAPDGSATLVFRVVPGARVTIAEVRVTGNEKTRTSFVLAHVRLERGDVYDVREVRESFRELYRTGLFKRVHVGVEAAAAADPAAGAEADAGADLSERRALLVELEETASTELFLEPGLGSYEGPRLRAGWRESNLLGSGRTLQLEGLVAQRAQRVVVGVSEPRLFGSAFQASLSLFEEVRQEPSFDTDERGAALSFSRELGPRLRLSSEYRFRRSEISSVDVSDPLAAEALNDVDISSVALSAAWDSRDSVFIPGRGTLLKASVEFADAALGSELDFLRAKSTAARFVQLADGRVLALSWRAGVIAPLENTTTIPLQERFFNGGENTVRSFKENELGPHDSSGEPLGGEAFHVFSAELRQRLSGNLEGALFADAGSLSAAAGDLFAFDDVRYALGVGLRYLLPIGPLRIDAGWNPDARDGEDDWAAHFSVGMSF